MRGLLVEVAALVATARGTTEATDVDVVCDSRGEWAVCPMFPILSWDLWLRAANGTCGFVLQRARSAAVTGTEEGVT